MAVSGESLGLTNRMSVGGSRSSGVLNPAQQIQAGGNNAGYFSLTGDRLSGPPNTNQLSLQSSSQYPNLGQDLFKLFGHTIPIQGPPSSSGSYTPPGQTPGGQITPDGRYSVGYHGPSGPVGPGNIQIGSYNPKNLSQDQREWLWRQFGHTGQVPVGYGGESPKPPAPPPLPPAPPPVLPPVLMDIVKSISGGGLPGLPAVSTGSKGGVQGQPFNAMTAMSQAVKGLGNLTSLPRSVIENFVKSIGPAASNFFAPSTSASSPQTPKSTAPPKSFGQQASDAYWGASGALNKAIGPGSQFDKASEGISKFAEPIVMTGGFNPSAVGEALAPFAEEATAFGKSLMENPLARKVATALGLGTGALATYPAWGQQLPSGQTFNPNVSGATRATQPGLTYAPGAKPPPFQFGEGTAKGGFNLAGGTGQGPATPQMMGGNLQKNEAQAAARNYTSIQDPNQKANIVAGLASPQGLAAVHKEIDQRQKAGDTEGIKQLADLAAQVQQNLDLQAQVMQIVQAISGGFGSPQGQDITAARTPMVQQGIGQALTGGVPPAPGFGSNVASGQGASQLPYRPPFVDNSQQVQQNRPDLRGIPLQTSEGGFVDPRSNPGNQGIENASNIYGNMAPPLQFIPQSSPLSAYRQT